MNFRLLRQSFRGFKFKRSREKPPSSKMKSRPAISSSSGRVFLVTNAFVLSLLILGTCCCRVALAATLSSFPSSQDDVGCDWSGSGFDLPSEESSSIRPVRLRCTEGTVEWSYPRGALRVTISPNTIPTSNLHRAFKVCVKVDPTFDGARIYSDDGVSLHPLFLSKDDDGKDAELPRCVTSSIGANDIESEQSVVLYVEADAEKRGEFRRRVASFSYDVTPLKENYVVDPDEECRPCDDEELLKAYCSSDYVIRGKILRVTDVDRLDRTDVVIDNAKTLRQSLSTSTSPALSTVNDARTKRQMTRIHAPLKCRVKSGPGEYLFAIRTRLGDPWLTCASTLSSWVRLMRAAMKDGRAPCVLDA